MQTVAGQNFHVVQTTGSSHNDIGEMCETELYGHMATRLGNDVGAAEAVLRELQAKGAATVRFVGSLGIETTMEIRRIDDQLMGAVRTVLRKTDSAMTPSDISRAVGCDLGPYPNILGQLEANGEIERVADGVQWKPERFAVVTGEPIG
jgi:hypothetical protein